MHGFLHWLFVGNGEETFISLWKNGPHMLWEISMNIVELLLTILIFRPLIKWWYKHAKKNLRTEIHTELDEELGIKHESADHTSSDWVSRAEFEELKATLRR